jgi:hypothetical protein
LRPLRFLRTSRDRVEADEGKEHHRGASEHAAPPEFAERAGVVWNEGMPVRGVNISSAEQDGLRWDAGRDAAGRERLAEPVGVVAIIANRLLPGSASIIKAAPL